MSQKSTFKKFKTSTTLVEAHEVSHVGCLPFSFSNIVNVYRKPKGWVVILRNLLLISSSKVECLCVK